LSNGSLYDVIAEAYPGSGTAQVSAIGFNISCGYMSGIIVNPSPKRSGLYNITFPLEGLMWDSWYNTPGSPYLTLLLHFHLIWMFLTGPEAIVIADQGLEKQIPIDSIILYTQNSVYDSDGMRGPSVTMADPLGTPPLSNINVTLQFLRCSKSLVSQIGRADTGSKSIIYNSLIPRIQKQNSTWAPYSSTQSANSTSLVGGDYVSEQKWFFKCLQSQ
jgi:hypothetical protein